MPPPAIRTCIRPGEAAKNAKCYVVIGVCERSRTNSGSMFNTQLFFAPDGQLVGKHQKLTPTGYERMVHWGGWGDTLTIIDTPFGPLSALACSENSNPLAGFDIIARGPRIHAMSWPPHFIMAGKGPPLPEISLLTARHFTLMSKAFVVSACGVIDHNFYKELAGLMGNHGRRRPGGGRGIQPTSDVPQRRDQCDHEGRREGRPEPPVVSAREFVGCFQDGHIGR